MTRHIPDRLALSLLTVTLGMATWSAADPALAYPTDAAASERTGIRRLGWQRDIDEGRTKGTKTDLGARGGDKDVRLRLHGQRTALDLTSNTPKDAALQAGLVEILKRNRFDVYNVALLDITDPARPRYAAVNETAAQTPGSVAKLLAATALLAEVSKRFPKPAERERFLRETVVSADAWLMPNSHEVPVVRPGKPITVRAVRLGDTFSLYEWLDHALSPSSNAAGTLVWREAALMRLMGAAYPPATRDAKFYAQWSRDDFTAAAFAVLDEPEARAGVPVSDFYLRLFFTKGAARYLKSSESRATPLSLLQWLVRVEQGRMVDPWVSGELKRLMYLTRKRIRYGFAPELKGSAVYFKSGSLFQCRAGGCAKYRGDKVNVLNGVIEVESPDGRAYLVTVMSNVLKRNAASDHAVLAGEIHRLIVRTGKPMPVKKAVTP